MTTQTPDPAGIDALREGMIAELRKLGAIRTEAVEKAVRTVGRHLFMPEETPEKAYAAEHALITKRDENGVSLSSVSAARIQAFMLEQADIRPGMRVLEIGSGGYNAARAQQLAALALGDADRQHLAEHALLTCLSDPVQVGRIRDAGICHGAAGLLHTTHRIARDAIMPGFKAHLPGLRTLLLEQKPAADHGFLDGEAGRALALLTAETHGVTVSGWDACMLSG